MLATMVMALARAAGSLTFACNQPAAWPLTSDTWGKRHVGALRITGSDGGREEAA
jgi:hypothetical protein